jgi:hypothetical protein
MYTLEDIRKSMRIYSYLLENKELRFDDDKELFNFYSEENIKEILEAFEEESKVYIKKYDDTIYFIPHSDNEFMGYKRSELKKEIFTRSDAKNIELFVAMYIMIQLTATFYNGNGLNIRLVDFVDIGELDKNITERLEIFSKDEETQVNERTGLVISDIAKYWFELINEDDSLAIRTRRWYINCVVQFLKKEGLVKIQDDTAIVPTIKFDRLSNNYFLNYERLEEINKILSEESRRVEEDAEDK